MNKENQKYINTILGELPSILVHMQGQQSKARTIPKDDWRSFDQGYYQGPYPTAQKLTKELMIKVYSKMPLSNLISEYDLETILIDFLRCFYVGQIPTNHLSFYNNNSFKELVIELKNERQKVINRIKLGKDSKKLFRQMIETVLSKAEKNRGIFVFPLFYSYFKEIDHFTMGECHFFSSVKARQSLRKFRSLLPNVSEKLIQRVKSFKRDSRSHWSSFCAIKTTGTPSKCFEYALEHVGDAFTLLKVVLQKNRHPSINHADSEFFSKTLKRLGGVYYSAHQFNGKVGTINNSCSWASWDDHFEWNHRKSAGYRFVNNYFYSTGWTVRSCVHSTYVNEHNKNSFSSDLAIANRFISAFKEEEVYSKIISSCMAFSDGSTEYDPIKQVLLLITALEGMVNSELSEDSGVAKIFQAGLGNLIFYACSEDWKKVNDLLGCVDLSSHKNLRSHINKEFYSYRSGLVHGSSRTIEPAKNLLIIAITSRVLFGGLKLIVDRGINRMKEFQNEIQNLY